MSLSDLERAYHDGESYTAHFMTNRESFIEAGHTASLFSFDFAEASAAEEFAASIDIDTQEDDFSKSTRLYLDIWTDNDSVLIVMRDTIITGPTQPTEPMTETMATELFHMLADDFIDPLKSTDSVCRSIFSSTTDADISATVSLRTPSRALRPLSIIPG